MKLKLPEIKNDAVKCPTTPANEAANSFIPEELKTFSEWQFDTATAELAKEFEKEAAKEKKNALETARQKRERQEHLILVKMGRLMQNNIIAAGRLTERVMKATGDGRPPQEIALLAVKGLSLLVNDPLLYSKLAERYREEYGLQLNSKPPYEIIYPEAQEPDEK